MWNTFYMNLSSPNFKWPCWKMTKDFCFTPNGHSCIAMCVCSYVVTKTNKVLCKYRRANNSSISLLNLHWKFLICHTMAKFLMTEIKFSFSWLSTSILGPLGYFCGSVSANSLIRRIQLNTESPWKIFKSLWIYKLLNRICKTKISKILILVK